MQVLRISITTAIVSLGLALLTGCSDSGTQNDRDAAANANGDTGQRTDTAGGSAAGIDLGDFAIPAPGGGGVARIPGGGQATVYLITYPSDRFDELVAYYDDWTSDDPDDYERREGGSGSITWQLARPGLSRIIVVLAPNAGEDVISVSLTESVATGR
jgi:hypothetical protein